MKKHTYLKRAFDYIEEHLNEEINLDTLARTGFVSLMQLYREFYSLSGHSIKDYIRKRRISNACAAIKSSDATITDIALASGFDSLPSFSRVFKKIIGLNPMEFKRSNLFYTFPPVQFPLHLIEAAIKIESVQPLHGLSAVYHCATADAEMEQQAIRMLQEALLIAKTMGYRFRIFGLTHVQEGLTKLTYTIFIHSQQHDFWTAALKEAGYQSITQATISGGDYAVLSAPFSDGIPQAWDFLYSQWLAKSMFTLADSYCCEEFIIQKSGSIKELRLSLPIVRKESSYIIEVTRFAEQHYIAAYGTGSNAEAKASAELFKRINRPGNLPETFYVEIRSNEYICGIESSNPASGEDGMIAVTLEAGLYAVLSTGSYGDFTGLADIVTRWLAETTCYMRAGNPFALYSVNETYEEVSMKVCIAVAEFSVINGQSISSDPNYNEDEEQ